MILGVSPTRAVPHHRRPDHSIHSTILVHLLGWNTHARLKRLDFRLPDCALPHSPLCIELRSLEYMCGL